MTDTAQIVETAAPAAPVEVTAENVDALLDQQRETPQETHEVEKKEEPKVNLGALHEERARRKALEAEKRSLSEQLAQQQAWRQQNEQTLNERLAALMPRQPQIDPNENPVGYLAEEQRATRAEIQKLQEAQRAQIENNSQLEAINRFSQHVQSDEQRFSVEKPDYLQAVAYAKEFKAKEYRAFGYSEDEVRGMVNNDALSIAQRALQLGGSPAEYAYQYALTVGFKPSVGAEKKLSMMEAGQKAAKPSGGGGKDTGSVTLEQLVSMSPEDFEKATSGGAFKKLMGG